MYALGIVELLDSTDMTKGRTIAGTGDDHAATASSSRSAACGRRSQRRARAGAELFLVPLAELKEACSRAGDMPVIGVQNLKDAVGALRGATVPRRTDVHLMDPTTCDPDPPHDGDGRPRGRRARPRVVGAPARLGRVGSCARARRRPEPARRPVHRERGRPVAPRVAARSASSGSPSASCRPTADRALFGAGLVAITGGAVWDAVAGGTVGGRHRRPAPAARSRAPRRSSSGSGARRVRPCGLRVLAAFIAVLAVAVRRRRRRGRACRRGEQP